LGGNTASLLEVVEESGVYKVTVGIADQEYASYASKDGKILFPEGFELVESQQTFLEDTVLTDGLADFIGCLEKAEFVVYGANWCGWTKKLIEALGGFDVAKPVYIECTEEKELCTEEGITGYPTIFIKGEEYQGARTLEDIAAATGCEAPSGAGSVSGENLGTGGCQ